MGMSSENPFSVLLKDQESTQEPMRQEMSEDNPFKLLIEQEQPLQNLEQEAVQPQKESLNLLDQVKLGGLIPLGKVMQTVEGASRSTPTERLSATKRGLQNIVEGPKQLYLEQFGDPKTAAAYTKKINEERRKYAETAAARNPYNQLLTQLTESAPYAAPIGMAGGLLTKMLKSGSALGGLEYSKFMPSDESRGLAGVKGFGIGAAFPLAFEAPGLAMKGYNKAKDILSSPWKKFDKLESKLSEVTAKDKVQKAALSEATNKAQEATGSTSLYSARGKAKKQLSKLPGSEKPTIGAESTEVSQKRLDEATKSHESAKKLVGEIEGQFDKELGKGSAHADRLASNVNNQIEAIEKHYSDRYKKFMSDAKDAKTLMPKKVVNDYEINREQLLDALKSSKYKDLRISDLTQEGSPTFKKLLNIAPTSEDVNLAKFMSKAKDFRNERFNLSQKLKDNITNAERDEIRDALTNTAKLENTIQSTLEKAVGTKAAANLKEINAGYSDIIFPLRSYNLAKTIKKSESLPENFIKKLSGKSAYPETRKAQQVLRNIVKSEPENVKNVLGQRYAGNIENAHEYDELAKEYFDQAPEIKKILDQHKKAKDLVKSTSSSLKESKTIHENLTGGKKLEAKNLTARKKLEDRIKLLDENISKLERETKKKNITLKHKLKLEKMLEEKTKERSSNRIALTLIASTIGVPTVVKKLLNFKS
jgi:hypothetical protein